MADDYGAVLQAAYPRVVASPARTFRDMDVAQDATHDAIFRALSSWHRDGVPHDPVAWLVTTGRNLVIDRIRRGRFEQPLPEEWDVPDSAPTHATDEAAEHQHLKDDLLRLLFTYCHPSLTEESQITLILCIVLDLSAAEIAAAFLSTREAVERRITRAKAALAKAGDGFVCLPKVSFWSDRRRCCGWSTCS